VDRGLGSTTTAGPRSHRIGKMEEILVLDPSRFSQSLSLLEGFFSFLFFSPVYVMRERQKLFK